MELNVIEQCLNLYKTGALYVSRSTGCDEITRLMVMCCSTGPVQRKRMEVKEKLVKELYEKGTQCSVGR